ncbi:glycosyl transferase [[Phormidium ambiguum] IAM M-71]|uniref:Glycosyl transferase n=1 Tax=[Phormidium ambiguum] IAM M-71 TaxID=454136 RepID=A0A1U7IBU2_9CYAN|nr:glycosyltransferase family 2 protein [Phormidium ambiguum]OKH34051.1 glycosyl transferase [Phormidium ambiguum IAM M-71]
MIYLLAINYYSSQLIAKLINSIYPNQAVEYQIIIVNNSPEDKSIQDLKTDKVVILESGENLGFGKACNLGLDWIYQQNQQAIVWLINPDAYLLPAALEKVSAFFQNYPELSILGTIIYTTTGDIWFAGGEFIPQNGAIIPKTIDRQNSQFPYLKTHWVSGCSLLINLQKFPVCPQFDPEYFLYYEDFDFCQRYNKQGHLIAITNQIGVVHQPSAITNKNTFLKFQHSTYSYLLTLEKYTSKRVLIFRFIRLLLNAIYLIPLKPKVALGKFAGISLYLRRGF